MSRWRKIDFQEVEAEEDQARLLDGYEPVGLVKLDRGRAGPTGRRLERNGLGGSGMGRARARGGVRSHHPRAHLLERGAASYESDVAAGRRAATAHGWEGARCGGHQSAVSGTRVFRRDWRCPASAVASRRAASAAACTWNASPLPRERPRPVVCLCLCKPLQINEIVGGLQARSREIKP
jgi:hypothetical protein